MDIGTVVSLVAASAAIASWWAIKRQVDAIRAQTQAQREIAEASVAPYIWVDVRVNPQKGWFLSLMVGNSGPTVATDIRVQISPPLPGHAEGSAFIESAQHRLRDGIQSLPPGRVLEWPMGRSPELVNREGPLQHSVVISGNGPHGPLPVVRYLIDLADFRETADVPQGTLREVRESLNNIAKELQRRRGGD